MPGQRPPFWDNDCYRRALRFAPGEIAAELERSRLACAYALADDAFWRAESAEAFLACGEQFSALGDYEDAPRRYYECQAMTEKIRLEQTYRTAAEKMSGGKAADLDEAKYLFTTLGDYRDAPQKAEACAAAAQDLRQRNRKLYIRLGAAAAVLVAAALIIVGLRFYGRYTDARAQAARIAENLAGTTYRYSFYSDDDFEALYAKKALVKGTVYWETEETRELQFGTDGTVYYLSRSVKDVLAYPVEMEEPKGYRTEYDGTYSSYSVAVSMDGEIALVLGESRFPMDVDAQDVPTAIYDYYTQPLTPTE